MPSWLGDRRNWLGREAQRAPAPADVSQWAHPSVARCVACGQLLRANGTLDGGKVKRWKCPSCGRAVQSDGCEIPVF